MTVRLYHADGFRRRFRSTVIGHGNLRGRPSVVLAETAFYPEAGGQMADRGVLAGASVVDVQEDGGVVHHVLEGARALIEEAAAETVSARLGESGCTIDVARDPVGEREIAAAEALANRIIDEDVAVRAWFPEAGELAAAEVPGAVDKLRRSLAESRADAAALREQLAGALAARLAAEASEAGEVVAVVPEAALLRPVASRLNALGKDALLAAAADDGTQVLIARAIEWAAAIAAARP